MKICGLRKSHPILFGYTFLLSILLAQSLTIYAQGINKNTTAGIENFGKVNDNYYRGSQPIANEFSELKKLGIKTIIDLREDSLKDSENLARAAGLQYFNIPLSTKRAATNDQTTYFLRLVNDQSKWPVFVHCKGGRHRTGEMTAIYRITQEGWTAEQAYDEMKKYDFEDSFFYPRSLKKYVFSYYERFAAQRTSKPQAVATSPSH
ncbi:MAG TPA: dual specificity protein phosphatase family protein [Pyrinomonadaceae bacterium]|nr:dual specificity protein phosphatase family protein [Pyrinomonadaceae bacterium]